MRRLILSSLCVLTLLAVPFGCFDKVGEDEDDDEGGDAPLFGEDTAVPHDEDSGTEGGDDGGGATPTTVEEACEAYVVAVNECTETWEEATGMGDTGGGMVSEEECEEVEGDLEQWLCVLDVMEAADCTTTEGLVQLSEDLARCLGALPGDTG